MEARDVAQHPPGGRHLTASYPVPTRVNRAAMGNLPWKLKPQGSSFSSHLKTGLSPHGSSRHSPTRGVLWSDVWIPVQPTNASGLFCEDLKQSRDIRRSLINSRCLIPFKVSSGIITVARGPVWASPMICGSWCKQMMVTLALPKPYSASLRWGSLVSASSEGGFLLLEGEAVLHLKTSVHLLSSFGNLV